MSQMVVSLALRRMSWHALGSRLYDTKHTRRKSEIDKVWYMDVRLRCVIALVYLTRPRPASAKIKLC